MKDPAVLLYTGDFLTGCTGLTMEERGQYITLLCLQHQCGHLSEKTIRLSVANVSVDVLKKFTIDEDGCYFNERMEDEIEKRSQFIESRKVNGSKGGRPKKEEKPSGKPSAKPFGLAKQNLGEDENRNEIIIDLIKWCEDFFEIKYLNKNAVETFDKLIRIDGYSVEDIKKVIQWARKDDFWSTNFLSPVKLRKQDKQGVKYIDIFIAKTLKNGITRTNNREATTWEELAEIAQGAAEKLRVKHSG